MRLSRLHMSHERVWVPRGADRADWLLGILAKRLISVGPRASSAERVRDERAADMPRRALAMSRPFAVQCRAGRSACAFCERRTQTRS